MSIVETRRRGRSLSSGVFKLLTERIRDGRLGAGDKLPPEAELAAELGVSRTVVREAISRLQAAGLLRTRHGVGSFVLGEAEAAALRIQAADPVATLREVIAVLELRLGIETEAAALAATRRSDAEMQALRETHEDFARAIERGDAAIAPDVELHSGIARATHNAHFVELITYLGPLLIPRTRIDTARVAQLERSEYLRRVHAEHDSIVAAIAQRDPEAARAAMRTHLVNSREQLRRSFSNGAESV